MSSDDLRIWEEFRKGGSAALSDIYHSHVDFLFNYGKKFTKDENLVLDAIHDVFIDLIRRRTALGSTSNIRLYLITSIRRKLFRLLENRKKLGIVDNQHDDMLPDIAFSVEEEIIEEEEKNQKKRLLQEALGHLNAKQREILYYKFTCGFDYSEICELMSVSYGTARQLVSRTIKQLKNTLPFASLLLIALETQFFVKL